MNTAIKILNWICISIMALFALAGNIYLAVVNYQLQDTNLFEKLDVYQNMPFDNPESFALVVHIFTIILMVFVIAYILLIRSKRMWKC